MAGKGGEGASGVNSGRIDHGDRVRTSPRLQTASQLHSFTFCHRHAGVSALVSGLSAPSGASKTRQDGWVDGVDAPAVC